MTSPDLTDAELAALEQFVGHGRYYGDKGLRQVAEALAKLLPAYRQRGEELRQVTAERDSAIVTVGTEINRQVREQIEAAEAALTSQGEALARLREENAQMRERLDSLYEASEDRRAGR